MPLLYILYFFTFLRKRIQQMTYYVWHGPERPTLAQLEREGLRITRDLGGASRRLPINLPCLYFVDNGLVYLSCLNRGYKYEQPARTG